MRAGPKGMWWGTAIEAPDPGALAAFYSELLGWPVAHADPGTAIVKPPQDSVFLVFQLAGDYVRPLWPPAPGEQRTMMHLDFQVEDLDAAVADAVALGARVADFQPQDSVRVLLDPAGRPFCLCRDDED
jgi:predicted enzyme related to lactoylglutathione lyase